MPPLPQAPAPRPPPSLPPLQDLPQLLKRKLTSEPKRSTVLAIVAAVLVFAGGAAILWYFLVARRQKVGSIGYDLLAPSDDTSSDLKTKMTETTDASRFSAMLAFHVRRFQPADLPKVLLAWGPIVVMLEKDTNEMYIGVRKNSAPELTGKATETVSTSAGGANTDTCGKTTPGEGPSSSDAILGAFRLLNEQYCLFQVQDCPFYKVTTLHLVYNYNRRTIRVYLDGALVKVCNMWLCDNEPPRQPLHTDHVLLLPNIIKTTTEPVAVGFGPSAPQTNPAIKVLSAAVASGEKSADEIEKDSGNVIKKLS